MTEIKKTDFILLFFAIVILGVSIYYFSQRPILLTLDVLKQSFVTFDRGGFSNTYINQTHSVWVYNINGGAGPSRLYYLGGYSVLVIEIFYMIILGTALANYLPMFSYESRARVKSVVYGLLFLGILISFFNHPKFEIDNGTYCYSLEPGYYLIVMIVLIFFEIYIFISNYGLQNSVLLISFIRIILLVVVLLNLLTIVPSMAFFLFMITIVMMLFLFTLDYEVREAL